MTRVPFDAVLVNQATNALMPFREVTVLDRRTDTEVALWDMENEDSGAPIVQPLTSNIEARFPNVWIEAPTPTAIFLDGDLVDPIQYWDAVSAIDLIAAGKKPELDIREIKEDIDLTGVTEIGQLIIDALAEVTSTRVLFPAGIYNKGDVDGIPIPNGNAVEGVGPATVFRNPDGCGTAEFFIPTGVSVFGQRFKVQQLDFTAAGQWALNCYAWVDGIFRDIMFDSVAGVYDLGEPNPDVASKNQRVIFERLYGTWNAELEQECYRNLRGVNVKRINCTMNGKGTRRFCRGAMSLTVCQGTIQQGGAIDTCWKTNDSLQYIPRGLGDEYQTLLLNGATGGNFSFSIDGVTFSTNVNVSGITTSAIQQRIEELYGTGNIEVTGAAGSYVIHFTGDLSTLDMPLLLFNDNTTGGSGISIDVQNEGGTSIGNQSHGYFYGEEYDGSLGSLVNQRDQNVICDHTALASFFLHNSGGDEENRYIRSDQCRRTAHSGVSALIAHSGEHNAQSIILDGEMISEGQANVVVVDGCECQLVVVNKTAGTFDLSLSGDTASGIPFDSFVSPHDPLDGDSLQEQLADAFTGYNYDDFFIVSNVIHDAAGPYTTGYCSAYLIFWVGAKYQATGIPLMTTTDPDVTIERITPGVDRSATDGGVRGVQIKGTMTDSCISSEEERDAMIRIAADDVEVDVFCQRAAKNNPIVAKQRYAVQSLANITRFSITRAHGPGTIKQDPMKHWRYTATSDGRYIGSHGVKRMKYIGPRNAHNPASMAVGTAYRHFMQALYVPDFILVDEIGYWTGATNSGDALATLLNSDGDILGSSTNIAQTVAGTNSFAHLTLSAKTPVNPGIVFIDIGFSSATGTYNGSRMFTRCKSHDPTPSGPLAACPAGTSLPASFANVQLPNACLVAAA